ncbi:hypothetical protein T09_14824 [Trichinella sp. T9]|nr:hypothetical protein T09_14824 [Trichinella sp. T9]
MAQQLRALTVLPKVLSSNSSNHMVAHNHLGSRAGASRGPDFNSQQPHDG